MPITSFSSMLESGETSPIETTEEKVLPPVGEGAPLEEEDVPVVPTVSVGEGDEDEVIEKKTDEGIPATELLKETRGTPF